VLDASLAPCEDYFQAAAFPNGGDYCFRAAFSSGSVFFVSPSPLLASAPSGVPLSNAAGVALAAAGAAVARALGRANCHVTVVGASVVGAAVTGAAVTRAAVVEAMVAGAAIAAPGKRVAHRCVRLGCREAHVSCT